ncbi:MAG: non-canonical purine NTP pyrophosphatase, partial [Acidimicrobiales bacterium]
MGDLPRLVCASANPDKVAEIALVLDGLVDLLPRPADLGDVIEDAPDLKGNARLKAVAVCASAGAGAVSDDTGL